jgi:hypothetical protein
MVGGAEAGDGVTLLAGEEKHAADSLPDAAAAATADVQGEDKTPSKTLFPASIAVGAATEGATRTACDAGVNCGCI